ncbi:MAG: recombinase family protein, partial [Lachnospiraceae bacterium]|nr:recombinase family protein [Lachnospiraceae bacterium]
FGYTKSTDKKLVVDDYAAEVVKAIFEHKLLGYNEQQIAAMLNAKGVHSPAEYKKASGEAYNTPFAVKEKSLWTVNAVKRILTNRVYIGCLEQGKRTKASYRVKKHFYKPREAWSVHENNHEPVISEMDFELVQELMEKDTRIGGAGQLQLFSGLIICGACGQPMTVKTTKKNDVNYVNYICSTHKRHGTCINNNISGRKIEEYTLLAIKKQIEGLLSADEATGDVGLDELKSRKKSAIEGLIEKSLLLIQEYNDYLVKSYTKMLDGVITESEYKLFRENFRRQIDDAEKNIVHLRSEIEHLTDDSKTRALIEHFKAHGNITELNRRIVVGFIQSVTVHQNKVLEVSLRYESGLETLPEHTESRSNEYERAVV